MQAEPVYYDDEIDLRELITTLLKGWKVILLLMVLGGAAAYGYSALQTPVYEASASLLIDAQALSLTSSPITLLQHEEVREMVAERLDVEKASLPSPTIAADKTDKTLFTLTVQSASAKEAAEVVNAWAEAGSGWLMQEVQAKDTALQEAKAESESALQDADRALVGYLGKHDLSEWTWAELSILTGVSNYQMEGARVNELPTINDTERLEIAELMRARIAKEDAYSHLLAANLQERERNLSLTPPTVLAYAPVPQTPTNSKSLLNTALGLVAGGMLGVFWVFAAAWWQNSAEEADK